MVSRPEPTDAVLSGLGSGKSVLVAGPSGVGKSAVVWMAAYVARHVVWYKVDRLREADVEPIIRLVRAAGAGRYGPVGLIVDGVGGDSLTAWDALQRLAAAIPGFLLLGSVREEDVFPLQTFGECVVVRPRLDEELASRIYEALVRRGTTAAAHWQEAFHEANGLTLEFTHLLTQGRRLQDVVKEQVQTRVRNGRDLELAVLAPVSAAYEWGGSLTIRSVTDLVGASQPELRRALSRLIEEHLVTVRDGEVRGLHPLSILGHLNCDSRRPSSNARIDDASGRL